MATATAPRSDVYLSLLAGRAITALADLAENPGAWNEEIKKGLEDGLAYCRAVRACGVGSNAVSRRSRYAFRRLATHAAVEPSTASTASKLRDIERLFTRLVARSRRSRTSNLVAAIEFLTKNADGEGC